MRRFSSNTAKAVPSSTQSTISSSVSLIMRDSIRGKSPLPPPPLLPPPPRS